MRGFLSSAAVVSVAMVLVLPSFAVAQQGMPSPPSVTLEQALGNVAWKGNLPSPKVVEGKSSIVLIYATWCPKCNKWSGELFSQLAEATVKQPVVLFAINSGEGFDANYIAQRKLMGPNIYHGACPGLHKMLGFDSNLFYYAIFSPEGKLIGRGAGGSFFPGGPKGKEFTLAKLLNTKGSSMGEFKIMNNDMPEQLRQVFWPFELGAPFTEKTVIACRRRLSDEMQEPFNTVIRGYLDKRLQRCRDLYDGEMPDKIKAYELAKEVMVGFGGTIQGKQCKHFVNLMDDNQSFKVEISASKAFDYAVRKTTVSPASLKREMSKVVSRFEETYFGRLAAEAIESGELPEI